MTARHPPPPQPARTPVGQAVALLVATAAALWAAPAPVWALPQDAVATLGQVVVRPAVGNTLEIVQTSNRAGLDWRTFSIAAGERLLVRQPDAAAVLFNRVTGADPSLIFGQLQANGRVFLSNPRGIIFGAGAQVDVGGLLATTLAVNTTALVNGNYQLAGATADTGTLQMDGSIHAPAGTVVLVGPTLRVGGTVQAGRVGLAAAAAVEVRVDVDGDGLIFFKLRNDTLAARLSLLPGAELRAGSAELRALARSGFADTVLNLDGVVRARGLGLRDGQVVIDGGSAGITRISGLVQADKPSTGRGGDVVVLGDKLLLSSSAVLDASGLSGGGSVRVGGDVQGGTAAQLLNSNQAPGLAIQALPPASQVLVQPGARLLADATRLGDGGRVIVWSDTATRFAGAASVRGGPLGGDGGLVEVSSKGLLRMTGSADRQAPLGRPGRLLLDPLDLEIGATADVNGDATAGDDLAGANLLFADQAGVASQITAAQVKALLAGGDVTLQATNNLRVTSAITAGGAGDFALTLQAGNNLVVDAPISLAGTAKALTLHSNADTGISLAPANPAGVVTLNSPISADGALIISNGVGGTGQHQFNAALTGASLQVTGGIQLAGSNSWTLAGNSTLASVIADGSGAGQLVKAGAGVLTLTGANTYSGGSSVLAGVLQAQNSGALGSGALSVSRGAALELSGGAGVGITLANAISLAGGGINDGAADRGAIRSTSGNNTLTGAVTLAADARINADAGTLTLAAGSAWAGAGLGISLGGAGNLVVADAINTGSGLLLKDGAGSVTLSGASSYSGTTLVAAGMLATSAANLLPSGSAVTVAAGATLALGGSQTLASLAGAGTLALAANPLLLGDASNTVFSGSLTGSGSLAKQGSGTLVLSGDNTTFSGPMAVLAGELQAQRSGALGSAAASVNSGAALALSGGISLANAINLAGVGINDGTADRGALRSSSGNNTLTGPITLAGDVRINTDGGSLTLASGQLLAAGGSALTIGGAGQTSLADVLTGAPATGNTLRKDGSGTLTLAAANLYTGATQVSGGTLATSGAGRLPSSSLLTVDAGASLVLGADQTLAALAGAGTVALGAHSLAVGAGTFSGDVTGTGALVKQGAGLLVLAGNSPGYSGPISVQAGVLRAQAGAALGSAAAATTVASGAALELAGDITLAEPLNLAGGGVVVGGAGAGADTGALRNASGNNTLTGAISLTADARINSDAGTLLLALPAGAVLLGTGHQLSVGGAAATSVGVALVLGSGTLVKDGAGTLTLAGSAGTTSSLGATLVHAGTLATAAANLLPSSSALTLAAGATLLLGGSQVLDNLAGSGTVALAAGVLTLGAAGGNSSFGGSFSGSAGWLKQGNGTLTLTGSSPGFSGSSTVQAGVLQVQTSQALGSAAASATVQAGATLALAGGITLDTPLTLAGSGVLVAGAGAGALRSLNGNNTVAGTITLAGTARINTDAGSLSLGRAGSDALLGAGQTVQLGGAGAINVLGAINTGSGGLLMDGSSTLTLAAASTYTGATQLSSGSVLTTGQDHLPTGTALALGSAATLTLGGAQTLGSLAGAGTLVLGSRALTLGDIGNSSFSGTLSGGGALVKQGTGSWTLASAQPLFSGPTTVLAGTLVLGHGSALAGSVVSLANQAGATLDLGANASINALAGGGVLGGVVNLHGFTLSVGGSGSSSQFSGGLVGVGGGLTKLGSGSLTLAGASSYSGSTLVSAGTLVAAHAAALGSAAQGSSVASGAALEISNVDIGAEPLRLAGSGPAGAGALLGSGLAAAASGAITLAANSQIGASGRLSLAGVISDAGQGLAVTKAGTGALVLTGTSSYSGGTQVAGGALVLAGAAARAGSGAIAVGANRLDLDQGAVLAQPVSINGGALGNGDGLGGGSGTGTLASTGSLLLLGDASLQASGAGLQINAVISQAGGARSVVVGGGKVTLTAANSYSGGTRLAAGTLVLDGALASAGSGAISVGANRLQLDHGAVLANTLTVAGGTLASGVGGGSVGTGASITLLGDATLQASADGLLVNAPIGESGGARRLDFAGGTITLRAANTSSGGGTLQTGTLVLDGAAASAGTGTLALGANRLQVDNGAHINQPITVAGGSLANTAGSATLASTARLTLLGDATLTVAGSGTGWLLDGVVDQAVGGTPSGLTVNAGSASVSLTSASSYSGGTTLQSGTLLLSGAAARPGTGTLAIGANRLVLNDGVLLAQAVTLGAGTLDNTRGSGTLGRSATLVLQADATLQTSGSGLQVLAPISQTGGPRALVLSAAGGVNGGTSITLGGANSYAGGTLLAAGTLLLQGGAALADNATLTLANSAGVRLQLQADETLGALAGGGAAGGTVLLDGHTLATGASGASSRFAGVLQDGAAPGSLVKQGAGSFTLAGANTLTGSSTVAAGSLVLDQPAALANSAVVLADGTGAQLLLAGPARIGSLAGGAGGAGLGALQGSVALGAHNLALGADGSSTTFAGVISGSGGLAKQGAGVLTLTGANTLTGATSVAGGSLLLGQADVLAASAVTLAGGGLGLLADSRIGSLAGTGSVSLGGFQLAAGGNQRSTSFAGVISGAGSLRKEGSGMLTLSGANQMDGSLLVSAGTLALQAGAALAGGTSVILADVAGATLALQADATIAALAGGGAAGGQVLLGSVAGGAASLTTGGTGITSRFDGQLSGPGQLIQHGAGVLTLGGANSHTGGTRVAQGTLALLADSGLGASGAALLLDGGTLRADADITLAANRPITLGTAGGSINSNSHRITLAGPLTGAGSLSKLGAGSLLLQASSPVTGATQVQAGSLLLDAGGALPNSAVQLAGRSDVVLGLLADAAIGSLAGGGSSSSGGSGVATVDLGSHVLRTGADGRSTSFAGSISGTGGLVKQGSGSFALAGSNSFTGPLQVDAGTLLLQQADTLAPAVALRLADAPGVLLQLAADQTIGALSGGGAAGGHVALAAFNLRTGGNGDDSPFAGAISGSGGLVKQGSGRFTLSGNNSFSGPLLLEAGTLALQATQALAPGVAVRLLDAPLGVATSAPGPTLALLADQTIGSLAGGAGPGSSSGQVALGGFTLRTGGDGSSTSFAGTISGSGGLIKQGAGSFTLSGSNRFTGALQVAAGAVVLQGGAALADSVPVQLANSPGVALALQADEAIGTLSGGGAAGGVVLLGSHTLAVGSNAASSQFDGVISGSGGLRKLGAGTLTLAGANSFSGATTVQAGTLALQGGAALADSSAVTLADATGATLQLLDSETLGSLAGGAAGGAVGGTVGSTSTGKLLLGTHTLRTGANNSSSQFSGVISGDGPLIKLGSGQFTLAGANTLTGNIQVLAGTLATSGQQRLLASSQLQVANNATLLLGGDETVAAVLDLAGQAADGSARLNIGAHTLTIDTPVGAGTAVFSGALLAQGGRLVKLGDGVLQLGGTAVGGGLLQVDQGVLLSVGGNALSADTVVQVAAGGTLQLAGAATVLSLALHGSLAGAGQLTITGLTALDSGLVASPLATGSLTSQGNSRLAAPVLVAGSSTLASGSLTLVGAGLLQSSSIQINSGATLASGAAGSLGTGTALQVASGGRLQLGGAETAASLVLAGSLVGSATGTGTLDLSGAATLAGGSVAAPLRSRSLSSQGASSLNAAVVATEQATLLSGTLDLGANALLHTPLLTLQAGSLATTAAHSLAGVDTLVVAAPASLRLGADDTVASLRLAGTLGRVDAAGAAGGGADGTDSAASAATTQLRATTSTLLDGGQVLAGLVTPLLVSQGNSLLAAPVLASSSATLASGSLSINSSGLLNTPLLQLQAGSSLRSGAAQRLGAGTSLQVAPGSQWWLDGDQTLAGLADLPGTNIGSANPAQISLGSASLRVGSGGADAVFSGLLSGAGSLVKQGAGRLLLLRDQAYGDTQIDAGILQLGNGEPGGGGQAGSLGSGSVNNQGVLRLQRADDVLLANAISGTGSLQQAGSGSLTLSSAANRYTGNTEVLSGLLRTSAAERLPDASSVTVASGARLVLAGNETVGALLADGPVALAGSVTSTTGDQRYRAAVLLELPPDTAQPVTLSAPGHTVQAQDDGNRWGRLPLSVNAGQLLLSAGRSADGPAGALVYRDLTLGAITLTGLEAGAGAGAGAVAVANSNTSSSIDAGLLRLGVLVPTGQAASGDARSDGLLRLDAGTLLLRAHARPGYSALAVAPGEGIPVDPLKGRQLFVADEVISQSANSQVLTQPGSSLQLLAPAGGSIQLGEARNRLAGSVAALSGADWASPWVALDVSAAGGAAGGQSGGLTTGQSRITLAGSVLQVGGRGLEADLLRLTAGQLSTDVGSVITARLWYNDAAAGLRSSTPGLRLTLLPEAFANPLSFGSAGQGLQVSVGNRSVGSGVAGAAAGQALREGLSAGFVQVLPRAGAKGSTAVYLAGPQVGQQGYSFFHDGAGALLELPVFYNGVLPVTPQLAGSLAAVAAVSETARRDGFDEAVRTENVAIRLRAGVIAEVGPGRPATVGSAGLRPPPSCVVADAGMVCAPLAAAKP